MNQIRSRDTMSDAIREARNYHDWVFESFAQFLKPGRAIEIGSGHGQYSRRIAPQVEQLIVSDIDAAAIEAIRPQLGDVPNVRYLVMDGIDPARLDGQVESVVLVNIIEHVEDDRQLLDRCAQSLSAGGSLIVFAPAFPQLFSRMDRDAGHFRRYTRRALTTLVQAAGFTLVTARYLNAVGFFGWLANKWIGSRVNSRTTNLQVAAYDRLIPYLRQADRLLPFLGQSLLVVGRKGSAPC
jgi:2-polyprenyl-3-methyl-5-hydroxy-6-metoxy-1,4-benzoquinol methylase